MNNLNLQGISVAHTSKIENLFDLCLLEEMDDDGYMSDILCLCLKNTPTDLIQLQTTCRNENFEEVYKTAHKLKSSAGLLKANDFLNVLIKIEETAKAATSGILAQMAEQASCEYKKLESPLQQELCNVQNRMRLSV